MIRIAELFDLRFKCLLIRYQGSRPDLSGLTTLVDKNAPTFAASESIITLNDPGVVFLLGRNGSGKSTFLKSLVAFGEGVRTQPQVVFRYAMPTEDEHFNYLETVESLLATSEFTQFERDYQLNLPFHESLIDSMTTSLVGHSFTRQFGVESASEVLELFGFSKTEISGFEDRYKWYEIQTSPAHPAYFEPDEFGVKNLNIRDYFPEFFLNLVRTSFVQIDDYFFGLGTFFNCKEWLDNPESRKLITIGLRQLFRDATHLDLTISDDGLSFSFVLNSTPTESVLKMKHTIDLFEKEYENHTFPMDLLESGSEIASRYIKFGAFRGFNWRPFSFINISYLSRENSISEISSLCEKFIQSKYSDEDVDSSYTITVTGHQRIDELLNDSLKLIRELEIGISGLKRIKGSTKIEWEDDISKNWLALDATSDGQLDVLRIIIRLCFEAMQRKNLGYAQSSFLLIDEFDRHLHPLSSTILLELLNRFGSKFGIYTIVSTHSVPWLRNDNLRRRPFLIAEKDPQGRMTLSTRMSDDQLVLASQLGTSAMDVKKLKQLIIVVEGDHDEIIITHLLNSNNIDLASVEISNLRGLYGLTGIWETMFSYQDAPVLVVYDKRNQTLEREWVEIQEKTRKSRLKIDIWTQFPIIKDLYDACYERRKSRNQIEGDTELSCIGSLIKNIAMSDDYRRNVQRLHLHGVEYPDIVDCLPISSFPKAHKPDQTNIYDSWQELRDDFSNLKPDTFKSRFKINELSVKKVLSSVDLKSFDPELIRLLHRIVEQIEKPDVGHETSLKSRD